MLKNEFQQFMVSEWNVFCVSYTKISSHEDNKYTANATVPKCHYLQGFIADVARISGQEGQILVKGHLHFKPSQRIVSYCMKRIHSSVSAKKQTKLIWSKLNEAFQKTASQDLN